MNQRSKEEIAEILWMEVTRAIFNSSEVRDCFNSMKDKDILDYLGEHDFLLDGEKLIDEMLDEPGNELQEPVEMALGEQEQPLPSVRNTTFPKGYFSVN